MVETLYGYQFEQDVTTLRSPDVNQDHEIVLESLQVTIKIAPDYDEQFARRALLNLSILLKAQTDPDSAGLLKQARQALATFAH